MNKKVLIVIIILLVAVAFILFNKILVKSPSIEGFEAFEKLPASKEIPLRLSSNRSIKYIEITINQGGKDYELLKETPQKPTYEQVIVVIPKKLSLTDGQANVTIKAKAGLFGLTQKVISANIDTIAPAITVLDSSYLTDQGSCVAALITAKDASSVYAMVDANVYYASNSVTDDKQKYFVIFPLALEQPLDTQLTAYAEDSVGNKSKAIITTKYKKTTYRSDTVNINDDFIGQKVLPLINDPNLEPVKAFIAVNEKQREETEKKIHELTTGTSADKILWEGAFVQMKNSKVFARFGDKRSYKYNDEIISHSTHLGFDLASLANSPVEAANSGIVYFTGDLGIYGNTVIIDHGLGLMSFYAHLSSIEVNTGDEVKKHAIIGRSGATGFAGGDHVHYAMLSHGQYISPVHWWDIKWIEKRILDVLKNVGHGRG